MAPSICLSSGFRKEAAYGCPSSLGELVTVRSVFPALSQNPAHIVEMPKQCRPWGPRENEGSALGWLWICRDLEAVHLGPPREVQGWECFKHKWVGCRPSPPRPGHLKGS